MVPKASPYHTVVSFEMTAVVCIWPQSHKTTSPPASPLLLFHNYGEKLMILFVVSSYFSSFFRFLLDKALGDAIDGSDAPAEVP